MVFVHWKVFGKFGSKNEFSCTGLNSVCSENTNLT